MLDTPPPGDPGFATKSDLAYTRVRALILSGELAPGAVLPAGRARADDRDEHHSPARGAPPAQAGGPGRARRPPGRAGPAAGRRRGPRPAGAAAQPRPAGRVPGRAAPHGGRPRRRPGRARRPRGAAAPARRRAELESHHRFHAAIHRASHNALLVETLDGLWVKTDRYRRHGLETGRSDEERDARAAEHRLLFEAVRDGDARDRGGAHAPARGDQPRRPVGRPAGRPGRGPVSAPEAPTGRPGRRLLALLLLHSAAHPGRHLRPPPDVGLPGPRAGRADRLARRAHGLVRRRPPRARRARPVRPPTASASGG